MKSELPFLNRLFNIKDVRYKYSFEEISSGSFNWSRDFTQFPGFPVIFPGEKYMLENAREIIINSNEYWHYSIYISIFYIITIFSLQHLMSKKPKGFDLKRELIIWNWLLALFSFLGTIRCWPEFIHVLRTKGFVASYTQNTYVDDARLNAWYWFFTLSKAPELIDTIFIVLRKRRLINLHWVHHTLTLIYSWFVFPDVPSTARWMVNMNLFIHSLMYSYYALTAMGYRFPRQVNVTLTTLQITQMLFGFYIHIDCLRLKLTGQPCDVSLAVAVSGFLLYLLFFLLFVNFFIKTYLIPGPKKAITSKTTDNMMNGKPISNDMNNNQNVNQEVKKLQ